MPLQPQLAIAPLIVAGIIAGAASIIGGIISKNSQKNANEDQKQFALQQYGQQRSDALADYQMQNEYNSPTAQMARYKAAGLNPNLIYGNVNTSSPSVRSSDFGQYSPKPVDISPAIRGLGEAGSSTLLNSYDVQFKEAQTDNLRAQNTVILQDAVLKKAQTIATLQNAGKTSVDTSAAEFQLGQQQRLADTQFEAATLNLQKTKQGMQIELDANQRAAAQNAQSLQEGLERIKAIKLQQLATQAQTENTKQEKAAIEERVRNLKLDADLKELDKTLKKNGIQPGDPLWLRALSQLFNGSSIKSVMDSIPSGIKNLRIN